MSGFYYLDLSDFDFVYNDTSMGVQAYDAVIDEKLYNDLINNQKPIVITASVTPIGLSIRSLLLNTFMMPISNGVLIASGNIYGVLATVSIAVALLSENDVLKIRVLYEGLSI